MFISFFQCFFFFTAFRYISSISGTFLRPFLRNKLHLIISSSSALHNPSEELIPAVATGDCCMCRRFRGLACCCCFCHIISYLLAGKGHHFHHDTHRSAPLCVVKSGRSGLASCYVVVVVRETRFPFALPSLPRVFVTRASSTTSYFSTITEITTTTTIMAAKTTTTTLTQLLTWLDCWWCWPQEQVLKYFSLPFYIYGGNPHYYQPATNTDHRFPPCFLRSLFAIQIQFGQAENFAINREKSLPITTILLYFFGLQNHNLHTIYALADEDDEFPTVKPRIRARVYLVLPFWKRSPTTFLRRNDGTFFRITMDGWCAVSPLSAWLAGARERRVEEKKQPSRCGSE